MTFGEQLLGAAQGKRLAVERAAKRLAAPAYRWLHPRKARFECPICGYRGPFKDKGPRRHAKCPACGALERARLQFAVLQRLLADFSPATKCALHIAPEAAFGHRLRARFGCYVTADLHRADVDHRVDVQNLPFADASFDFVFASHVLEYPCDDRRAIAEIRRVLAEGGIAVLPVPLLGERTVDRVRRHPVSRLMHEPGLDYFDRMRSNFRRVDIFRSDDVAPRCQPFVCRPDGRERMPVQHAPGVFVDMVPVCHV